jgi:hypothetical protein
MSANGRYDWIGECAREIAAQGAYIASSGSCGDLCRSYGPGLKLGCAD